MFNQHAKWLDISKNHVKWRAPVASENILLSSTVWRQDHNGFSHQDPGFIDLVTNKSASVTRIYLPPDANTLLSVADHCLRSTDFINVIVADKQKHLQFTTIDEAIVHCTKGMGIWAPGQHRRRRGARRRPGQLRRRGHAGGAGRRLDPARAAARPEAALRERRRPVQAAAGDGPPARFVGARVRRAVHPGQADHLQLPRLSLADPPAGLSSSRTTTTCTSTATGSGATSTPRWSWPC